MWPPVVTALPCARRESRSRYRATLGVICAVAAIALAARISAAATYYVAPTRFQHADGSRDAPWSWEQAVKRGGGHTYIFRPGVYRGPIVLDASHAGTRGAPTILKSEVKWKARVFGSLEHVISVSERASFVTIDGFEVWGAGLDGIKVASDQSVIRNCWIHNNAHMGIASHRARGLLIEANLVEFNGMHPQFHHGMYVSGAEHAIRSNIVRHNAGYGIHLYPSIATTSVENNVVYGQANRAGIILDTANTSEGLRVANNTIAHNASGIVVRGSRGAVLANNIVAYNDHAIVIRDAVAPHLRHNLYDSGVPRGEGDVVGPPNFVDAERGTYWLGPRSAALSKGSALFAPPNDFWGARRSGERAPDIGAYQGVLLLNALERNWQYRFAAEEIRDPWLRPDRLR